MPGGNVNQSDALIQATQKVGATVAVVSAPVPFIENGLQLASLSIGALGLIVAAFSAWVNFQRFNYQKEQDQLMSEQIHED
jgi:beta-lactamase regulating signal transducer with metallopeptidase domain